MVEDQAQPQMAKAHPYCSSLPSKDAVSHYTTGLTLHLLDQNLREYSKASAKFSILYWVYSANIELYILSAK